MEKLKNQIKVNDGEKKTLMMGFQELKTLNENRELNYREEIKYLKKTIEELIEAA